ncbi:mannose-1-phosphate guanylyltransferase [Candidatus Woesearchaeota archaeon]|nr:mannose-1-phosphate guanylyltransferase [Candidatus Woesearchaeota archaeon]
MLKTIILAGGSGKRLWPLSRGNRPKQCLSLVSRKTLLEDAVERMEWVTERENITIVTTKDLYPQLHALAPDITYIIEPMGRGTAASIGLALIAEKGNPTVVIGTADHAITNPEQFAQNVEQASALAESGHLVLFGIPINRPETGYGYITRGKQLATRMIDAYVVDGFKEKPNVQTAAAYMQSGCYFWNSGMMIAKRNVLLDGFRHHMPALWDGLQNLAQNLATAEEVFAALETVSIDVGVTEKSHNVAVVRATFLWDDVGDFLAFSRLYPKDEQENVIRAKYQGNARGSIIVGSSRIIYAHQVNNLVIVDTDDTVLVSAKDKTQDVGKLVTALEQRPEFAPYARTKGDYAPGTSYCHNGSNTINNKDSSFVATVGVSGLDIIVNSQSVIVKNGRC